MIDNKTQPLEIAAKVLNQGAMDRIMAASLNLSEKKIIDRWALTEPENLKALESRTNVMVVIRKAREQAAKEWEALDSDQGRQMLKNGLSRQETLDLLGVDTRLGNM